MTEPAAAPTTPPRRFGTFAGVFRPISLTIMGAMLYLREGWLVGEAGVVGALLVICAAYAITGTTSMSLASIASNVRVRPGGAFAIIAQALGLEAGAAIGVPLYIAQAASVAMYIYAFAEGWAFVFPEHPPEVVEGIGFAACALLAWRSSGLALKAQGVMLIVVVAALGSAALGIFNSPTVPAHWVGELPDVGLVGAFAIFFPAATGIMVGAGMSGSLKDPRRSIPKGTLLAWATTFALYAGFAGWYGVMALPDELISNRSVIFERALVPELVLAGLLSSTLMAALSSLVAAPQLLQAMANHGVVPLSGWLAKTTESGEPRNAVLLTTALATCGLAAGSLDAIAPVITSFFIMTYLAINGVVAVERTLGMISFRPAFKVNALVPVLGVGLCLLGLSLSSPFGGALEVAFVLVVYAILSRRKLETPWETVRSGMAVQLAAWTARRAARAGRSERAWKPDLLVPVANPEQMDVLRPVVEPLARRNGTIRWVGLGPDPGLPQALDELEQAEKRAGLHATTAYLRTQRYMEGIGVAMDALRGSVFPPNLVVVDESRVSDVEIADYQHHCEALGMGMALYQSRGAESEEEARAGVCVWLSDRAPEWRLELHQANLDLPVLVGFLLATGRGVPLRLCMVVRDDLTKERARRFLEDLIDQARLPAGTTAHVAHGDFLSLLGEAPRAELHLFGMPPEVNKERLEQIRSRLGAPCLWLRDSGHESALA
jgi:amino acid transporter